MGEMVALDNYNKLKKASYRPDEVALICGKHVKTVRRWIRIGELPAKKDGLRGYRVERADLEEFLEREAAVG